MVMKVKTSELTDAALDWVVATCEGYSASISESGEAIIMREGVVDYFDPHRNWGWGGPIIEREKISIRQWVDVPVVNAYIPNADWSFDAASPLIAAMRCYVASKLGDFVEVPEELLNVD